ncbi:MAG: hypothetical protein AAF907_05445 [Planctomycetota bacterium]
MRTESRPLAAPAAFASPADGIVPSALLALIAGLAALLAGCGGSEIAVTTLDAPVRQAEPTAQDLNERLSGRISEAPVQPDSDADAKRG